ncbi:hypothetical protein H257_15355 [Aphanomyces astaci]|uniref:SUZ domain-containing protein n=1 Tax=Aphanomyces astaci TaxID=112090 RepID=W4FMP3_APHAT|nr:hypothetical protein H257_15355 [Aphanomyces astaci]ETV68792.1 hypothetical protein H257_15355 [Aphanomyces astaci]|eukprot:XP_009841746.1 hypothetical protein H257_15355 [Aphanomyces astaci]
MSSKGVPIEDEDWDHAEVEMSRKLSEMHVDAQDPPLAAHASGPWGPPSTPQKAPSPLSVDGHQHPPLTSASSSVSSPVSRATATAVSLLSPLDPVLVAALENSRERLTLLQFEDQIVTFLKNPREHELVLPSLSSYHRLIVHRLAERCHLEHQTADYYHATGYDPNAVRVVTLFKTPRCAVPSILLIDLAADTAPPLPTHHTPAHPPKIMSRKKGAGTAHKHHKTPAASSDPRSMQDREKAYAEARARIFGDEAAPDKGVASVPPTASASSAAANQPSSTKSPAAPSTRPTPTSKHLQQPQHGATTHPHHHHAPHQQDWKQSKAQYRDRQKELNDPDFARHHQPRGPPPSYTQSYNSPQAPRYPSYEYYTPPPPPPPASPFQSDGYYRQPQPPRASSYTQGGRNQPPPPAGPATYSMDADFPPLG